jgi:hypothetical protein
LPTLTPDERTRVAQHIQKSDPSYASVVKAIEAA